MTDKSKHRENRKPNYPFTKLRVYFNAIAGFVALLLCLTFMISYSELLVTLAFLSLTTIITVLSFRLKVHLLGRMEKSELEIGYPSAEEDRHGSFLNWRLVAVVILLALVLLLPVVSALFVDPLWWFVAFASFVVGFSLSEVLLYMYTEH